MSSKTEPNSTVPLSQHGFEFRNTPANAAVAQKFHMSSAVTVPAGAQRIIVSGKIGSKDGKVPETLKEEMDQAFENVEQALRAAGLNQGNPWDHVFKVQTFETPGPGVTQALVEAAGRWYGNGFPVWTAVVIHSLWNPNAHVEVEVEAYIPPTEAKL